MKNLYLDHNLIIDIQKKRKPSIVEAIEDIDRSRYQILFSPAHIEEIAALQKHFCEGKQKVDEVLNLLKNLTNAKALLPYKRRGTHQVKLIGVYISDEHPEITYKRVVDGYERNSISENHQREKYFSGEQYEKKTGVSSRETNNLEIKNKINDFKLTLHQIIVDNYHELVSKNKFYEYLPSHVPENHEINFESLGAFFPLHEMTIEKIFEYLERIRYFPEKSTSFLSGLHDTTHAIYAAYCDVFVTNDKKLRNKTEATYKWLGINTLILSPDEFLCYLDKYSDGGG